MTPVIRQNIKTEVTRRQSTLNFPKNEHFLPSDKEMYIFRKMWRAFGINLFAYYRR